MKISNRQWDEWLCVPVTDRISAESEVSGILSCFDVSVRGEMVTASCERLWPFRRVRRLWKATKWSETCDLGQILRVEKTQVSLSFPLGLYRQIYAASEREDFIRWAWARGVFGVSGGIYNPKRGYYLIMRIRSPLVAASMKELLEGNSISCSERIKERVCELTIRDIIQIASFCYYIGISEHAQSLEQKAMIRSLRNMANKQANCDEVNIRRSLETARYQLRLARFVLSREQDAFSPGLLSLVHLRLNNPSATLSELGVLLKPHVSKSTVKYRWKKIEDTAEELGFRTADKD